MIELLCLILWLAGNIDAKLLEYVFVNSGKNDGGMCFAEAELFKLLHSKGCNGTGHRRNRECYEYLVNIEFFIRSRQISALKLTNRLNYLGGKEMMQEN